MSVKSNFLKYVINGEKIHNNLRNTFFTTIYTSNENSTFEKPNLKKRLIIRSMDKDKIKLNIRQQLKEQLLLNDKQNFSYANNMNNEQKPFHSAKHSFNFNLISKMKKLSYIKDLFKNFLSSLKEKYNSLYKEFLEYLSLYSNETELIRNSDIYQYDIFTSVFNKFSKKVEFSNSDIIINNGYLSLFENLFKDYINLLSKNTNQKCIKFISNYHFFYKKIVLMNSQIHSDKIIEKEKELDNSKDIINLLKEQILNLEQINFSNNHQKENFDLIKKNLEEIIEGQSNDMEKLKNKINDLETQIKIKDYEIKSITLKLEETKKNINNQKVKFSIDDENINNENNIIDYQEKLDYEYLLGNRIERIRFLRFKIEARKKNKIND